MPSVRIGLQWHLANPWCSETCRETRLLSAPACRLFSVLWLFHANTLTVYGPGPGSVPTTEDPLGSCSKD